MSGKAGMSTPILSTSNNATNNTIIFCFDIFFSRIKNDLRLPYDNDTTILCKAETPDKEYADFFIEKPIQIGMVDTFTR